MMNATRKSDGWRSFVFKLAMLCLVWLVLATTFAMQFYWIGKDWPLQISWKEAFVRALVEWCPWMILSPVVVWLAERCRFDRARRFWGVLPHLPACLAATIAYQGISMLLTRGSGGYVFYNFQAGDKSVGFASGGTGAVRVFGSGTASSPAGLQAPGAFGESTNIGPLDRPPGETSLHFSEAPFSQPAVKERAGPQLVERVQFGPGNTSYVMRLVSPTPPPIPGPWTRYFQLAFTRAQSAVPIYWTIVCVTWVLSYYQQLRERERRTLELEARLMQANLQTLKAQLQPHFLFNTLNAIASLVRRKPDVAEDMIGSLSDFLRVTLDTEQQHEVPLRREIEFLDLYLEMQQGRFGKRLNIQKEIDSATLNVPVPTLILQPLVENSVRHGIEPRESGGTIVIRAWRCEDRLRLEVCDDGEGLKTGQLTAFCEGVGLSNTKARLQELYGDAHRFKINPNEGRGLTVTVELPWRSSVESGTA